MSANASAFSSHFSTVAPDYDVLLSRRLGRRAQRRRGDRRTPATRCASSARSGGTVVLITNAPRPGDFVQHFIDRLKVPRDSYDAIVSSGDVTRALIRERAGERGRPHRSGARPADLRRPRRAARAGRERRLRRLLRPVRRHHGDAGRLRRRHRGHARAQAADDLRQSRHRGRARRPARLLRRRDRRPLCRQGRRRDLCRQAVSADLRAGDGGGAQGARAATPSASACWRSATRCAPTSRARPRSASTACS